MNILDRFTSSLRRFPSPAGPHANLKIAAVTDELTRTCLAHECQVVELSPTNYKAMLTLRRPDLLFIESAWQGLGNAWKYRIASYPDHPERSNRELADLIALARELGIPSVFWNKEDCVHFERFINSAKLADVVLTVDSSCVSRYRTVMGSEARVGTLPFAVQPRIHSFTGIDERRQGACFVGSYSTHIHDIRRQRQDLLLRSSASALGLTIFDRNSNRSGDCYRYPELPGTRVRGKVSHSRTGDIYKSHLVSLNVNTVEHSDSMFSRRLIEILACGGMAVSTPARSIELLFKDYCHVVSCEKEAADLFARLASEGYRRSDLDMMHAGAEDVLANHTWAQRIGTILEAITLRACESTAQI